MFSQYVNMNVEASKYQKKFYESFGIISYSAGLVFLSLNDFSVVTSCVLIEQIWICVCLMSSSLAAPQRRQSRVKSVLFSTHQRP